MTSRDGRLAETITSVSGPLARLGRSLAEDEARILRGSDDDTHDLLATDAFLQRFQQLTDLALRKLLPRLLASLEQTDVRHPLGAMLDRLDGYEQIEDVTWWLELNELRNRLVHEYAMAAHERRQELARAWSAAGHLHREIARLCAVYAPES